MKVSVISTWWDKPVDGWMDSIKNQTYENIEIVAGNEESFGFKERMGAGKMRNELSKLSHGDIILFIDADAVMMPNVVEEIVKIFKEKDVDAVSGLPIAPPREKSNLLNHLLGVEYEERIRSMGEGYVSVAASTCFAIKRSVFFDIGGFVETFKGGIGEDWYMSAVLTQRGYKIWHTNKAEIYHFTGETLFKYLRKQFYHAWYRVYHVKKFGKIKDEYSITRFNLKRYNFLEKVIFPLFYLLRGSIWLIGAMYGIYTFYILKRGDKQ